MEARRRFSFKGTATQYIEYLENRIASLETPVPPPFHVTAERLQKKLKSDRGEAPLRERVRLASPDAPIQLRHRQGPGTSALEILDDYFAFASVLQRNAEREIQQSRFAGLLFLAICCVSREAGVQVDIIDDRIRRYFKNQQGSSYCGRLRTASKWAAQLMEKLEVSLGRRGPELFLLYGEGISLYHMCSGSLACANYIATEINQTTKSFQLEALREHGVSFAPSFMLTFMGLEVNKALGTHLSQQEYDARAKAVRAITSAEECQDESNIPSTVPARESGNAGVELGRKRGRNTETTRSKDHPAETNAHRPTAPVGKTQTRTSDRPHTPISTATPQGRPDPSLSSEGLMPQPGSEEQQAATSAADVGVDQRSPDAIAMHYDDPRLTTAETGSHGTGMDLNHREGGACGLDSYDTNDVINDEDEWMNSCFEWDKATGRIDDAVAIEGFSTGTLL
ncbi:hypothetical protein DL765_004505 [Monosporascus sp. GIB2]|nr:hypothetical protein DL765_004505 [Monosporascus sp. GIB2]